MRWMTRVWTIHREIAWMRWSAIIQQDTWRRFKRRRDFCHSFIVNTIVLIIHVCLHVLDQLFECMFAHSHTSDIEKTCKYMLSHKAWNSLLHPSYGEAARKRDWIIHTMSAYNHRMNIIAKMLWNQWIHRWSNMQSLICILLRHKEWKWMYKIEVRG